MTELLDFVDRFQTIIVGIFGFAGVIWTLHINARNAATEHRRAADARRSNLRRLLTAELRNYSRALRKNLTMGAPEDESFSIGRIQRNLFESVSSDLGLLKPGEIDVVVNAIISFGGMNHFLENSALEHTSTRFLLPVQTWEEYAEKASTVADVFDFAIEAIELSEDS